MSKISWWSWRLSFSRALSSAARSCLSCREFTASAVWSYLSLARSFSLNTDSFSLQRACTESRYYSDVEWICGISSITFFRSSSRLDALYRSDSATLSVMAADSWSLLLEILSTWLRTDDQALNSVLHVSCNYYWRKLLFIFVQRWARCGVHKWSSNRSKSHSRFPSYSRTRKGCV